MNHYGNAEIHLICKFNPMESYWLGKYLDCNSRVIKYHNRANVRLASGYSLFECWVLTLTWVENSIAILCWECKHKVHNCIDNFEQAHNFLTNGPLSFLHFRLFCTIILIQLIVNTYVNLPMTGFEPRISDVGTVHFTNLWNECIREKFAVEPICLYWLGENASKIYLYLAKIMAQWQSGSLRWHGLAFHIQSLAIATFVEH